MNYTGFYFNEVISDQYLAVINQIEECVYATDVHITKVFTNNSIQYIWTEWEIDFCICKIEFNGMGFDLIIGLMAPYYKALFRSLSICNLNGEWQKDIRTLNVFYKISFHANCDFLYGNEEAWQEWLKELRYLLKVKCTPRKVELKKISDTVWLQCWG